MHPCHLLLGIGHQRRAIHGMHYVMHYVMQYGMHYVVDYVMHYVHLLLGIGHQRRAVHVSPRAARCDAADGRWAGCQ